jgi:hypothetical protein
MLRAVSFIQKNAYIKIERHQSMNLIQGFGSILRASVFQIQVLRSFGIKF